MEKKIVFNGKEYNRIEDMPAAEQQVYKELMQALDTDGNGVIDVLERGGFLAKIAGRFIDEAVKKRILLIEQHGTSAEDNELGEVLGQLRQQLEKESSTKKSGQPAPASISVPPTALERHVTPPGSELEGFSFKNIVLTAILLLVLWQLNEVFQFFSW